MDMRRWWKMDTKARRIQSWNGAGPVLLSSLSTNPTTSIQCARMSGAIRHFDTHITRTPSSPHPLAHSLWMGVTFNLIIFMITAFSSYGPYHVRCCRSSIGNVKRVRLKAGGKKCAELHKVIVSRRLGVSYDNWETENENSYLYIFCPRSIHRVRQCVIRTHSFLFVVVDVVSKKIDCVATNSTLTTITTAATNTTTSTVSNNANGAQINLP